MQEAQNTKIVQDAYAAFGRGDIPALLALFDDNIVWMGVYGAGAHVPTSGTRRGKTAVAEFFKEGARAAGPVVARGARSHQGGLRLREIAHVVDESEP